MRPLILKGADMPYIQIRLSGERDAALARAVAHRVTTLTRAHLGKDPRLTAVAVEFVPADQWFIGDEPLAGRGIRSYYLGISVTDETNTKDDKAAYIAAVHASMGELLGGVDEKSYVQVTDARAAAYGYGGLTQERRYVHAQLMAQAAPVKAAAMAGAR
jgi:4-oxalocrotonate tautomerase